MIIGEEEEAAVLLMALSYGSVYDYWFLDPIIVDGG